MAFAPASLALAVDTIGGGNTRIHFYEPPSTDDHTAVTADDYFADGATRGLRANDIILVSENWFGGTNYIARMTTATTATIDPQFQAPASQAEAEAGTSNLVGITPLRAKQAIAALGPDVIRKRGQMENLWPNPLFQVATQIGPNMKPDPSGGAGSALNVTGYTTGSNAVVVTVTDLGNLKVGDLVWFDSDAHAYLQVNGGGVLAAQRVTAIGTNTFTTKLHLGLTMPGGASAACLAYPLTRTNGGSVGLGPDGITCSTGLSLWQDDHTANQLNGSDCVLAASPSTANQTVYNSTPTDELPRYRARNVVVGMYVRRISGTGQARAFIHDGVAATAYGPYASGTSWTWIETTALLSSGATLFDKGVEFSATGVWSIAYPMFAYGNLIGDGGWSAPRATSFIPAVAYGFGNLFGTSFTWPNVADTADGTVTGLGPTYGFLWDVYAGSAGAYRRNIRWMDHELEIVSNVPASVAFTRNRKGTPILFGQSLSVQAGQPGGGVDLYTAGRGRTILEDGTAWLYTNTIGKNTAVTLASADVNAVGL